jgi:hypothetical protein
VRFLRAQAAAPTLREQREALQSLETLQKLHALQQPADHPIRVVRALLLACRVLRTNQVPLLRALDTTTDDNDNDETDDDDSDDTDDEEDNEEARNCFRFLPLLEDAEEDAREQLRKQQRNKQLQFDSCRWMRDNRRPLLALFADCVEDSFELNLAKMQAMSADERRLVLGERAVSALYHIECFSKKTGTYWLCMAGMSNDIHECVTAYVTEGTATARKPQSAEARVLKALRNGDDITVTMTVFPLSTDDVNICFDFSALDDDGVLLLDADNAFVRLVLYALELYAASLLALKHGKARAMVRSSSSSFEKLHRVFALVPNVVLSARMLRCAVSSPLVPVSVELGNAFKAHAEANVGKPLLEQKLFTLIDGGAPFDSSMYQALKRVKNVAVQRLIEQLKAGNLGHLAGKAVHFAMSDMAPTEPCRDPLSPDASLDGMREICGSQDKALSVLDLSGFTPTVMLAAYKHVDISIMLDFFASPWLCDESRARTAAARTAPGKWRTVQCADEMRTLTKSMSEFGINWHHGEYSTPVGQAATDCLACCQFSLYCKLVTTYVRAKIASLGVFGLPVGAVLAKERKHNAFGSRLGEVLTSARSFTTMQPAQFICSRTAAPQQLGFLTGTSKKVARVTGSNAVAVCKQLATLPMFRALGTLAARVLETGEPVSTSAILKEAASVGRAAHLGMKLGHKVLSEQCLPYGVDYRVVISKLLRSRAGIKAVLRFRRSPRAPAAVRQRSPTPEKGAESSPWWALARPDARIRARARTHRRRHGAQPLVQGWHGGVR